MSEKKHEAISFKPIGFIHTAYKAGGFAPNQPLEREDGEATVEVLPEYQSALADLSSFRFVILVYHLNHSSGWKDKVTPPWAKGKEVGMFASRTPQRPNPIGVSIAKIKKIDGNKIITLPLDVYDGTPLLDIKPYIESLDAKDHAGDGWIETLDDHKHLLSHLTGAPHAHHAHDHGHDHDHKHGHDHSHDHHHGDHGHSHEKHHHKKK